MYYKGCLVVPLIILLIIFLSYIIGIVTIGITISKTNAFPKVTLEKCLTIIIVLLISIFIVKLYLGYLVNGGIFLVSESEADAIVTTGVIDSIEDLNIFQFNKLKSEYQTDEIAGVCFSIDGRQFYAIAKGSLKTGDEVIVTYLPKSAYILEICKKTGNNSLP